MEYPLQAPSEIVELYRYLGGLLRECGYFDGYEHVSSGMSADLARNLASWARWFKAEEPYYQGPCDRLEVVIDHGSHVRVSFYARRGSARDATRTVVAPAGAHAAQMELWFGPDVARVWSPRDVEEIETTFRYFLDLVSTPGRSMRCLGPGGGRSARPLFRPPGSCE